MPKPTAMQRAIRRRDNYTCKDCGVAQGTMLPPARWKETARMVSLFTWPGKITTDNIDDYISVCQSCYSKRLKEIEWIEG